MGIILYLKIMCTTNLLEICIIDNSMFIFLIFFYCQLFQILLMHSSTNTSFISFK